MDDRTTSLATAIQELGRQHGVPDTFLQRIRALFLMRGIALEADAAPFEGILEETFKREMTIRASSERASRDAEQIQRDLSTIRRTCDGDLESLREAAASAEHSLEQLEANRRQLKRIRYRIAEFYTPLDP